MSQADPIQVFENHAGPIPPHSTVEGTTYHFAYVAYRDAERDAPMYGYGYTQADAIADFVRNEAEAHCANCPAGTSSDCQSADECILTSGELAALIKREIQTYYANQYGGTTWKALNMQTTYSALLDDSTTLEVEASSFTEATILIVKLVSYNHILRIVRLRDNKTVETLF